ALEQLTLCRTMILDKTGTLTYGRPVVSEEIYAPGFSRESLLPALAASEQYSRHPVAGAIVDAARQAGYALPEVEWIREEPGVGLPARVDGMRMLVTGRAHAAALFPDLPPGVPTGLECIVIVNGAYAAAYRFHDVARQDGGRFIAHLGPKHDVSRVLLVSGDREA